VLFVDGRKFVVETRHAASRNVNISRNLQDHGGANATVSLALRPRYIGF
jgi:hypothetical protein